MHRLRTWLAWLRHVIKSSDVTPCDRNVERRFAFAKLAAGSDAWSLVGVMGKRRGHHRTAERDTAKAWEFWQRCEGVWKTSLLETHRQIVVSAWSPARPAEKQRVSSLSRR